MRPKKFPILITLMVVGAVQAHGQPAFTNLLAKLSGGQGAANLEPAVRTNAARFFSLTETKNNWEAQAIGLARLLEAGVNQRLSNLKGMARFYDAKSRQSACQELLGATNYSRLADFFTNALVKGTVSQQEAAAYTLGLGLACGAGVEQLEADMKRAQAALSDDTGPTPVANVVFTEAEALCYLGSTGGVWFLESALESSSLSDAYRKRAITAIAALNDDRLTEKLLAPQLNTDDPRAAYAAFDVLESVWTKDAEKFKRLNVAALAQFKRLDEVRSKRKLSPQEELLLLGIATNLKLGIREGYLGTQEKEDALKIVCEFLVSERLDEREAVSGLFSSLANDSHTNLFTKLLADESERVRGDAALGLSNCKPETIKPYIPELLKLAQNGSQFPANFALYALRQYRGEKCGNFLSDAQFKVELERVRLALKDGK